MMSANPFEQFSEGLGGGAAPPSPTLTTMSEQDGAPNQYQMGAKTTGGTGAESYREEAPNPYELGFGGFASPAAHG
eukprot:CAMPEP_0177260840 /NCGR_PEP_ID=MMETSP0367-20130122/59485_1 /TAXON_ID=447022 ORGANISM="Scrippsiella hangoei-like, Strain SHHI-4" /NCGR_SAMPLE_ID=MMETSP0367 /ASSEMBLY_ACC=CAM_ASM_000362 /LENGTH=75 /DNA_ID=CAMNT_0018715409 /DNA_START=27 /DNA_END=250 /DNA_ORIENTATION=+